MNARQPSKKTASKKSAAPKKPVKSKAPAPRAPRAPKPKAPTVPRLLVQVIRALDAKKADAIQILDVRDLSSITDYLVLANATSQPHLRALRVELEKAIDAEKAKILGIDKGDGSGWMVVDAFDVMVQLFTKENRDKYRLDLLWRDAQVVDAGSLL